MHKITDVKKGELSGKQIFVRVDWNVPMKNGVVVDDFRIRKSFETISFLLEAGAALTLGTHIEDKNASTGALLDHFWEIFGHQEWRGKIKVLPNLRTDPREITNDLGFAKELAVGMDMYVNEAFPVSHRVHASVVALPSLLPQYAGVVFEREVSELSRVFTPEHPFIAILGGAKFDTKLPLVRKFSTLADEIHISGALCVEFFRSRGYEMGCSLESKALHDIAEFLHHPKIKLPVDVITQMNEVKTPESVGKDDIVLDVGPATVKMMEDSVRGAGLVVWNGPLGKYEEGFSKATDDFALVLSKIKGRTVLGGGDTVASLQKLNILDRFSFVSTGGGAMLDFLANETLPGIEALNG